ncbi:MAG TPA: T9SS type A sorting domain-containing protein, partial [Bacteroidetes bacterium]|nr:T9SS type A sorting domain-containing protein [Bacteroidota bacterium]
PIFNEFHEKYGCNTGDVFTISIDQGDNTALVQAFETTYGGSFSHAPAVSGTDGGGNAVNATYGPSQYPTYVLIGPDNKFINIDIWPISSVADLEAAFPANAINPQACAVAVTPEMATLPISIFPNPATHSANVDLFFNENGAATLEVISLVGTTVLEMDLGLLNAGEHQVQLDLAQIEAGTYFVKVTQENAATAIQKLSILH